MSGHDKFTEPNLPLDARRLPGTPLTKTAPVASDVHTQRRFHELQTHQIELEMRNDEPARARENIEESLAKYTDLFDFAPIGYFVLNRVGVVTESNLTGAKLFGTTRSALLNRCFAQFVIPEDRPLVATFLQKVFGGVTREECDVRIRTEGRDRVDVRLEAIVCESGLACRVAVLDITAQKIAEAAEAKLATIVRSSSDAIIGKDLSGKITSWNPGAERIFGYSESEMLGSSILRLIPPDREQEEDQIMRRLKNGESIEHFETVRVAKDGRLLDVSVAISPMFHANGEITGFSKVARDITEQKRVEADRQILNKLESTGILAGGIAHDSNNLLTTILLNLELVLAHRVNPGEMKECLEMAMQSALTSRGLTQQLITFADGGAPIRKATELPSLIRHTVRLALSGAPTESELFLPGDLWLADVDAGQLGQVIQNLVINAREAMSDAGVVSIRAENVMLKSRAEHALPPGNYVRLSITDQGVGIPKEILSKIFDPYVSTKQRGSRKGMGLGLTICHSVIQRHGGAITVESNLGQGTTFEIYLPASNQPAPQNEKTPPNEHSRRGRLLVMDDDEGVRQAIGVLLRWMGYEVDLCSDGGQAVEAYENGRKSGQPFDAVFLDLTVRGGMGGLETIQVLRKADPDVRAVVISGHTKDTIVVDYEKNGFNAALTKPFEERELRQTLARVMGN